MTTSPDDVPSDLRRRWSRALAAAGLFDEALRVHPAADADDTLRRGELAVLALDHATALRELKELDGDRDPGTRVDPWRELLLRGAKVMSGEPDGMSALTSALEKAPQDASTFWVYALAAQSVGSLTLAGQAAAGARHGGSRDPRLLAIEAAAAMADGGDLARALDLTRRAQHIALADEDPAAFATELLIRGGHQAAAVRLATEGAGNKHLPYAARQEWHAVARSLGAGRRLGSGMMTRAERQEQAQRRAASQNLICRCWGSTGWLGPDRMHYVDNHLGVVVPEPVAGLEARLLRCPATAILFLDFARRQITLPVSVGG